MKKQLVLTLVLSLCVAAGASAYSIGLYADPAATSCDLPAGIGLVESWYLVAKLAPGEDLLGVELRITGLPADWVVFSETEAPGALRIGSAFSDPGMLLAFSECQDTPTRLVATIQVVPLSAAVGELQVVALTATPSLECGGEPVVLACDGVSLLCVTGEHAFVNQTGCLPTEVFSDGFESGGFSQWSDALGGPCDPGYATAVPFNQGGTTGSLPILADGTAWVTFDNSFPNHQIYAINETADVDLQMEIWYPDESFAGCPPADYTYDEVGAGVGLQEEHNTDDAGVETIPNGMVWIRITNLSGLPGSFSVFDSD